MEIQGSDGSKTQLKPNSTTLFGRGNGFSTKDLAVSRRHISFDLIPSKNSPDSQTAPRVSFEVLGKNPVWVYSKEGDEKVRAFKRFKRGELGVDDLFCVSAKNPVWFTLKKVENDAVGERRREKNEIEGRFSDELNESLEFDSGFKGNGDFGLDSVDVSNIDPVQEFGFLAIGHEFDKYPKKMIREIKDWNWFLEDLRGDSDDEGTAEKKRKAGGRRKRKQSGGDDDVDEEWTGESEEEDLTKRPRKLQRPKYDTRSKDHRLPRKSETIKETFAKTSNTEEEEEFEDEEDEQDETLGGFIVDDDTAEEEEEENESKEDEEEEFVEDEDEMED